MSIEIKELKNEKYRKLAKRYNVTPETQTRGYRECDFCGHYYEVKFADLKRGWGMTCSKSCSTIKNQKGYLENQYCGTECWEKGSLCY